ncbi:efflux RND transporter periplasmic adaptor subunit [Polyangium sp. y55x31]|uniref:efflux RND transporter periplasmic adaptor subunit n=1 Tax=Polyangium sp. y55x31 TaxID=3042688 RepID=UPI0024821FC4|nr:efflux RND transporter periplasmic adaptor subunit [Polyangium sp. y55x31]MDI1483413.1 efflux RND transporter periplasmic adaptor subunit [Polyangium sp. y55x31]
MSVARRELGAAIFVLLPLLHAGCRDPECAKAAAQVDTPPSSSPGSGATSESVEGPSARFVGVILSRKTVDIAPRFDGKIGEISVRLGDRVPEGGLIAVLDAPSVAFDVRMAAAALKSAELSREQAKQELAEAEERLARREGLSAEGLSTGEDVATARYQVAIRRASVEALSAQIEERRAKLAQLRRSKTDLQITAPFEGYIAARFVDPGASVTATTPVVRLVGARSSFVRFAVQESEVALLSTGRALRIATVDGGPEVVLDGKVDRIAPEIDAASRMVVVEATIEGGDLQNAVLAGRGAEVSLRPDP